MSVDNAEHRTNRLSELALGGDTPYTLEPRFASNGEADSGSMAQFIAVATIVTNAELLSLAELEATSTNAAQRSSAMTVPRI